ncbi:MAG: hypothetical protein BWY63_01722 [Chloroflexi bacterium ADurb.Bin360]|nr:MAG: hypothetical protein BWY63_01722 [Chloroflexi bacterium ADurb.Bin360]
MCGDGAPVGGVVVGVVGRSYFPAVIQRANPLLPREEVGAAPAVAHFFKLDDFFNLGMVFPVVEVDPARMVELHHCPGAIERQRARNCEPVVETIYRFALLQIGGEIGINAAHVTAHCMAHRVVDVDMPFCALRIFKAAQSHENAVFGEGFGLCQSICPFGIINRVGVIGDRQEIQPSSFGARESIEGSQGAV